MRYWGSSTGRLYALAADTGATLWTARVPIAGLVGPAVVGGVVYVGGADGTAYAVKAATGRGLWTYDTGASDIVASPAVADGVVYVAPGYGIALSLVALDAGTGTLLWSSDVLDDHFPSSPMVANGVVYLSAPQRPVRRARRRHRDTAVVLPPSGVRGVRLSCGSQRDGVSGLGEVRDRGLRALS